MRRTTSILACPGFECASLGSSCTHDVYRDDVSEAGTSRRMYEGECKYKGWDKHGCE